MRVQSLEVGATHEPGNSTQFIVPMRVRFLEVAATHEPGNSTQFIVPMRVQSLEVGATHEPCLVRQVLECASPVALSICGLSQKRHRAAALQKRWCANGSAFRPQCASNPWKWGLPMNRGADILSAGSSGILPHEQRGKDASSTGRLGSLPHTPPSSWSQCAAELWGSRLPMNRRWFVVPPLAQMFHSGSSWRARHAGVAQVSNLLYRRFPIGRLSEAAMTLRPASGWETHDTADWQSALHLRPAFAYEISRLGGQPGPNR